MPHKNKIKKLNLLFLLISLISLLAWPVSASSEEIIVSGDISNAQQANGIFAKITPLGELKVKEEKIALGQGAGGIEEINNPLPEIRVIFDQDVTLSTIRVKLYNLTDNSQLGSCSYTTCTGNLTYNRTLIGGSTFVYKPATPLIDGAEYKVTAEANDTEGNPSPTPIEKTFKIVLLPVNITLIEPPYGATNINPFNMTIGLDRDANCRHSFANDLYGSMTRSFASLTTTQKKANMTLISTPSVIYVSCNDSYGKLAYKDFSITWDAGNPAVVSYGANPSEVTQDAQTTIFVNTSESTICRYSDYSDVAYSSMSKFPGYDNASFANYHNQTVPTPTDSGTYHYYVQCEDRAGNYIGGDIDHRVDITYITNFNAALQITTRGPYVFSSTSNIYLNISVNKRAICFYSNYSDLDSDLNHRISYRSGDASLNAFTPTTKTLSGLSPGSYTYYIYCFPDNFDESFDESDSDKETYTISIDTSNPVMLSVNDTCKDYPASINDPDKTWRTDKLYLRLKAQDNETEVTQFVYRLVDDYDGSGIADGIITGINEQSNHIYEWEGWIEDLDLNESQYKFYAYARNEVGRNSSEAESNGILVDTSLAPQTCNDGILNGEETDIDCGGDTCNACGTNKNCTVDDDCQSINCENGKCKAPTCTDEIQNQNETDVDCGGRNCGECEIDEDCEQDSDCKSGHCSASDKCIALPDECANGVKDSGSGETDVDCGGDICEPCGPDQSCRSNDDCVSGTKCIDDECKTCSQNDLDCDGTDNCEDDDIDGDGKKNWEDNDDDHDGVPDITDSDDDGDGVLDPNDKDCDDDLDNDGIKNCLDNDIDGDNSINTQDVDDDNDGLADATDQDDDNDGVQDDQEDCDNDGMPQGWEERYCDGNCNPDEDSDGDGLTDIDEFNSNTDPTLKDTDGDSYSDKIEIDKGTDPTNAADHPKSNFLLIVLIIFLIGLIIGGGFYGWKVYQNKKEEKPAPIARMPPMQPRQPLGQQTTFRRELNPEERKRLEEVLEKRRQAKTMERRQMFGAFGQQQQQPGQKPAVKIGPKPEIRPQTAPKPTDVFSRLAGLSAKKPTPETRKEAKQALNQLSAIAKSDTTRHEEIKKGLSNLKTQDEELKGHISSLRKEIASLSALKSNQPKKEVSLVIGSKLGTKYHLPNCIVARKLPKSKTVTFKNETEALKKGYKQCSVCFTSLKKR